MAQNNIPINYGNGGVNANPYMPYGMGNTSQPYLPSRSAGPQVPLQTNVPFLKGRLVSSIEEARAQSIDFDGSIFYFPDLANQKIYTKQINPDGTSTLNMYELKEIPKAPNGNDYITRQEFEQVIRTIAANLPHKEAAPVPAQQNVETPTQMVPDPDTAYKF